jgi:hypothetical protein
MPAVGLAARPGGCTVPWCTYCWLPQADLAGEDGYVHIHVGARQTMPTTVEAGELSVELEWLDYDVPGALRRGEVLVCVEGAYDTPTTKPGEALAFADMIASRARQALAYDIGATR